MFEYFEENVISLQCASFTTDYEKAMRKALQQLYPAANKFACYFHYCQAVKKRAYKTNGLSRLISSNADARLVYYRIMCLPLLPHTYIKDMFFELKNEAYTINKNIFRPFIWYCDKQWLQNVNILFFYCCFCPFSYIIIICFYIFYRFMSHRKVQQASVCAVHRCVHVIA